MKRDYNEPLPPSDGDTMQKYYFRRKFDADNKELNISYSSQWGNNGHFSTVNYNYEMWGRIENVDMSNLFVPSMAPGVN